MPALAFTGDGPADALLGSDPLALLIGMVLDQQIPIERAFHAPYELRERLGGRLDPRSIAAMAPEELTALFAERPALHRYPASMARRIQELCATLVHDYGGDAARVWSTAAGGEELLGRLKALPGFGDDKARKFLALLGKRLGAAPPGWREASSPFGEPGIFQSVADIDGPESLAKVRSFKRSAKAAARAREAG
jgi:uncharacterized HhH-GPD family protein